MPRFVTLAITKNSLSRFRTFSERRDEISRILRMKNFYHAPHKVGALLVFTAILLATAAALFAQTPTFTKIIVFGDSLSDTGNIAHRTRDEVGFSYPSGNFNYSDYRFTNSSDTTPSSDTYVGVWHEQVAHTFLHLPIATNSLDGGANYAFGGATTVNGSTDRTVINNPTPFGGGDFEITIDNMGKQVDDYLAGSTPDPNALYVLWGGGNDLFDDSSTANVIATSARVKALIQRFATAGVRKFLVPNVPPLGSIPNYVGQTAKVVSLDAASAAYRTRLNADLNATINALAGQGIAVTIYRVDVWLSTVRILAEPSKYGFTNVRDSAQFDTSADPDKFLFWDDIHPTTAGHFQIAAEANRALTGAIQPIGKALNISTRAAVGTGDNVSIIGFIITGTNTKKVLLRAIGPSLSGHGVSGPISDPTLTLYDNAGRVLTSNDNWRDTQQAEIQATGAAPTNPLESAIVRTLNPGSYTAILRGKNGGTGIGLVEIYDLSSTANSVLANLSTRGLVGTGENVMIAGFIIGNGDKPILALRALGPSLTNLGVAGALQDPTLELHDRNGALIASNDNWKNTQDSAVAACGIAPKDVRESAIVRSLAPGNYTAIVRGKNNTTGIALIEAYRVK
jgi:phospholipase/lecithinase/hemolysin